MDKYIVVCQMVKFSVVGKTTGINSMNQPGYKHDVEWKKNTEK